MSTLSISAPMAFIRWKLRSVMAERKISNSALGKAVGKHETTISRLRQRDLLPASIQIIFHLTEAMARYKVSVNALADELNISHSSIANWRSGKIKPGLNRINEILVALTKIGDQDQLKASPLQLSDVLEWRVVEQQISTKKTAF
mgnify:CR=1 FL=1